MSIFMLPIFEGNCQQIGWKKKKKMSQNCCETYLEVHETQGSAGSPLSV